MRARCNPMLLRSRQTVPQRRTLRQWLRWLVQAVVLILFVIFAGLWLFPRDAHATEPGRVDVCWPLMAPDTVASR